MSGLQMLLRSFGIEVDPAEFQALYAYGKMVVTKILPDFINKSGQRIEAIEARQIRIERMLEGLCNQAGIELPAITMEVIKHGESSNTAAGTAA